MPFSAFERRLLLAVKGVGPTVLARFEQLGYDSLPRLARANALDIQAAAANLVDSTCWKNSPQARAAVQAAIDAARACQSSP